MTAACFCGDSEVPWRLLGVQMVDEDSLMPIVDVFSMRMKDDFRLYDTRTSSDIVPHLFVRVLLLQVSEFHAQKFIIIISSVNWKIDKK